MKLNEAKVESIESYKKIKKQKHNIIHGTNAITLIALVITIVILIILAGVAINLSIGENGIFSKAKQAREMMKIASVQEKLELEKTNLLLDSNEYTVDLQTYINKLIEKGIISSTDVENTEYDNSKLITVEGYVFLLTEEDKDIKIEVQGKVGDVIIIDRTKPVVTVMSNTANTATIKGSDNSSGIVGYVYAKTNTIPTNFIECENTLDLNITIENLDVNTTYYIWVKDAVGNISECKTVTTSVANYSLNSGVKYETLAQAVENAVTGDTIKVISDYTDTSDVSINKSLTLNTNGKTLTRTKTIEIENDVTVEIAGSGTLTTAEEINLITNNGTLNITHEGTISSTNEGATTTIYNTGTLNKTGSGTTSGTGTKPTIFEENKGNINISNGKIISTNSFAVYTSGIVNVSNNATIEGVNNALFLVENATATISEGNLTASKYDGIYTGGNSKLTIFGGTITGVNSAIYHESTNTIEINGGNLIGTSQNGITVSKNGSGNIEINNGNISGKIQGIWKNSSANLIINGGTIKATTDYDGIFIAEEDTGNVIVTNGTIVGNSNAIGSTGKGNITVSGGTLTGNNYRAISMYKASLETLTVTGGTLTGKESGIVSDTSTIQQINISGGTISGREYYGINVSNTSNVKINANGGNIQGMHNAIILYGGDNVTLNVLKGNLTGTTYDGIGVYANATVNVGDSTKAIDNNSLVIVGGNYGVFKSGDYTSTINYNNGTLKGKIAGYTGTMNIRSGYRINTITSGEYKEATLVQE